MRSKATTSAGDPIPKEEIAPRAKSSQESEAAAQKAWRLRLRSRLPIAQKLLLWTLYTVLFSLVPVVLKVLVIKIQQHNANWSLLLGDGELAIIATALAAASMGEVFSSGQSAHQFLKGVACWTTLVCAAGGCVLFILAQDAISKRLPTDWEFMAILSTMIYVLSIVTGGFCLLVSRLGAPNE
jgi:hypothetical protein